MLLNLMNYFNKEDEYLTGNPQITFFRFARRPYIRFDYVDKYPYKYNYKLYFNKNNKLIKNIKKEYINNKYINNKLIIII